MPPPELVSDDPMWDVVQHHVGVGNVRQPVEGVGRGIVRPPQVAVGLVLAVTATEIDLVVVDDSGQALGGVGNRSRSSRSGRSGLAVIPRWHSTLDDLQVR